MRLKCKIVICVKDHQLLKELADIASSFFEVIGCTDPEITAQSIVPSEIFAFVTDSVALLRRSREMNEDGHRILVTDFTDLDDIVDGINDKTVHHLVNLPVRSRDFMAALTIIHPTPRVFSNRNIHPHPVGHWGARN